MGEVQHGIERLSESHRKTELLMWVNKELIKRFGERILPSDTATLLLWGSLIAPMENSGQPIAAMDSLL